MARRETNEQQQQCDGRYVRWKIVAVSACGIVAGSVFFGFAAGGWVSGVRSGMSDHEKRLIAIENRFEAIDRIETKLDTLISRGRLSTGIFSSRESWGH